VLKRIHIFVKGRVQGVYYRYNTLKKADEFHLTGWVRNRPDGNVEIVCEGSEKDINELILWCKSGPAGANVTDVISEWEEYTGEFNSFEIR